ncbi:DNA polymerase III, subunit gamma and tau [Candidatus Nomurabacteria bacterium CG1_02_47_685]|nr:MAG: DNA polymerase III, subunit gamma and tau [Candidatus Nomurabacteria bacterium CG1_02_47_685]
MSEFVLYRKYRPQTWDDVIGQDHVVNVIKGAIKMGNLAHAYLFAGSRGTGKTSVARILAHEIGCSNADLYEIDAASRRGIDDIRELRESVRTLPFESKFKVYIIDEAHMLTKEAFNALLKTLEEPPEYVVFILATTEQNKIPETVISRCQAFTFKRPTQNILRELVLRIAEREGFSLGSSSADLIAFLGEGSFRDTQGILQKVISSSADKKISLEEVEQITGAPRNTLINDFITAIRDGDTNKGLIAISSAAEGNIDMRVFLKLILHKVRTILLLRFAKDMESRIKEEFTAEEFAFLKELAGKNGAKIASPVLNELLFAYDQMRYAYLPQLSLELALMKVTGCEIIS